MKIEGLDYNTSRDKLRLMAYGRDIQKMVDICMLLPTKAERQGCAASIIEVMRRVVPGQMGWEERNAMLWYHLALMSNFQLDIDYPVDITHEDKMAVRPEKLSYSDHRSRGTKHYGNLLASLFDKLKSMPEGDERTALAEKTAVQMFRCLQMWGIGTADKERVVSDLARYTDGVIQLDIESPTLDREFYSMMLQNQNNMLNEQQGKKKKKKK